MSSVSGKIAGNYRLAGDRRAAYLRLEESRASWHEGGRETFDKMEVTTGQFHPAENILAELTGVEKYNFKLRILSEDENHDVFGILDAEGSGLYFLRDTGTGVDHYQVITEEEALELVITEKDQGDPISCPPGPYQLQPHHQGRFVFLTGAPGLGKSTTAQLLARLRGFVYYEEDCFHQLRNPYIPLSAENPTMEQEYQRNLTGQGREEREQVCKKSGEAFEKLLKNQKLSKMEEEYFDQQYNLLCEDIARERLRIGGDWVIAGVLLTKHHRDLIRKLLGPELIIVILTMPNKNIRKRLFNRHPKDKKLVDILMSIGNMMEKVSKHEENVVTVPIKEEMTKEEIMKLVLQRIDGDLPLKEITPNICSNVCCIV